jgi:hypothetical protein
MVTITNPTERRNTFRNFFIRAGTTKMVDVLVKASEAFESGAILVINADGLYVPASAGDPKGRFVIARRTVAATDPDYASNKTISAEVPLSFEVEIEFTVSA